MEGVWGSRNSVSKNYVVNPYIFPPFCFTPCEFLLSLPWLWVVWLCPLGFKYHARIDGIWSNPISCLGSNRVPERAGRVNAIFFARKFDDGTFIAVLSSAEFSSARRFFPWHFDRSNVCNIQSPDKYWEPITTCSYIQIHGFRRTITIAVQCSADNRYP